MRIKSYIMFNESREEKLYQEISRSRSDHKEVLKSLWNSIPWTDTDINHLRVLTNIPLTLHDSKIGVTFYMSRFIYMDIVKLPDDYFLLEWLFDGYQVYYKVDGWDGLAQIIKDFDFYDD